MEHFVKILLTFENQLPNPEADAEVFVNTAKSLVPLTGQCRLHVPVLNQASRDDLHKSLDMEIVAAVAPLRPAWLRHLCCGLTLVFRRAFREADLIYTRNLWIAWLALLFGQRVVFDHYRPWADQIPPLRLWISWIMNHRRFLVHICHSDYTRQKYLGLGIPENRLECVHNGFAPQRLGARLDKALAKESIGIEPDRTTVVYTGRVNHKKGLELAIAAARRLPEILFVFVGSYGKGSIERLAKEVSNVQMVPWQSEADLPKYMFAADMLLIPPSSQPLLQYGTTVLPLKLFLYLACGRPIIAGDTPDVREILTHGRNAYLCQPDSADSLVAGIKAVATDPVLSEALATAALRDSCELTWEARGRRIISIVEPRLIIRCQGTWFRRWLGKPTQWFANLNRHRPRVLPPAPADQTEETGIPPEEWPEPLAAVRRGVTERH